MQQVQSVAAGSSAAPGAVRRLVGELLRRQPVLTAFGLLLWALLLPVATAAVLDPRLLNDVRVWIKPAKFLLSLGLFSVTTAWFFDCLQPAWRRSLPARAIVVVIVAASSFELTYIGWQASLGQASHFNVGDAFHATMYSLMGLGAVSLTTTSGVLAWLVARHGRPGLAPVFMLSVVLGLVVTATLGPFTGAFMSAQNGHGVGATGGAGLPLFGWSLHGGDYRVAHFFALHAQQLLPLAGAVVAAQRIHFDRAALWLLTAGYVGLIAATFVQAHKGLPFHSI